MFRILMTVLCLTVAGCDLGAAVNGILVPAAPQESAEDRASAKVHVARIFVGSSFEQEVVVPKPKPGDQCPTCFGSGITGDGRVRTQCGACRGTGKVPNEPAASVIGAVSGQTSAQPPETPANTPEEAKPLSQRIAEAGRERRVIVFTDPQNCIHCRNMVDPELAQLAKTGTWVIGPSSSAHIEVINVGDMEKFVPRYNATVEEITTAFGVGEVRPMAVLLDKQSVVKTTMLSGTKTLQTLILSE